MKCVSTVHVPKRSWNLRLSTSSLSPKLPSPALSYYYTRAPNVNKHSPPPEPFDKDKHAPPPSVHVAPEAAAGPDVKMCLKNVFNCMKSLSHDMVWPLAKGFFFFIISNCREGFNFSLASLKSVWWWNKTHAVNWEKRDCQDFSGAFGQGHRNYVFLRL